LGTGNVGKHLVGELHLRKAPKETLPATDKNTQAIKVGEHPAVLITYRDEKRVAVEWRGGLVREHQRGVRAHR
jgi:hypothetical protein